MMPTTNMNGPFPLTERFIDQLINMLDIGNYALGIGEQPQGLTVQYIGRSDTGLNKRIKEHIGESYTHFMFSIASDAILAYQKECINYHDYTDTGYRLKNLIHPAKPKGHPDWLKCPRCSI